MKLGFVPLHPKGVRPEADVKSSYETRPRAYASGQSWEKADASGRLLPSQMKQKHTTKKTKKITSCHFSLSLFFFPLDICELVQRSEAERCVDSPTLLQNKLLFSANLPSSWRGRCGAQLGANEPEEVA